MAVLKTQSEFGHAPPPQTPFSIITNLPGWDTLRKLRDGDEAVSKRLVHIYPRLEPTHFTRVLGQEVANRVELQGQSCMVYLNPSIWQYTAGHVIREQRGSNAIAPHNLTFKVIDVADHRLYVVLFKPEHKKALMLSWGIPGIGLSLRHAAYLLNYVDTITEVPFKVNDFPKPTWTPEGPAHDKLRQHIVQLLHHGAIDLAKVECQPRDVFLFPSGMAAIFYIKSIVQDYKPGISVEFGVIFQYAHQLLYEESLGGLKHFGKVDGDAMNSLEAWLNVRASEGSKVSFVFVEFSGNPTLESVDLHRLKQLSDRFSFLLIVDDTVGGFSNIDVLGYADILLTSLTKSFSGKADVLGGSVVLNPLSSHYNQLSARFAQAHQNELFMADAEVLLANSQDYFARTCRLNNNGKAIANFLHKSIGQPDSPVTRVHYPSLLPSKPQYDACMRRSTPEFPEPGYGCLLTVDFDSLDTAKAFYEHCGFYPSPHFGGHVTLIFAYNMFMYGRDFNECAKYRQFGLKEESVRISAGLENVEDLIDTVQDALDAAIKEKRKEPRG